ncbi:ATP phosphoribosyltransferase regulatory subunit [Lactiplantibacillus sp. WILCCON 0030]|uniref:ATP phosphoribosyltransferase regulatory subunit n=1 Tax=Lactiplantibacillus brownii TaxID=3069269 RepID=A0ABU1AA99_9LACO|nr:ATP phosphoribosyltransferase regulatory subunit [Lactiplantibacillus brownii]MDQ7937896.1 ATP phosphoribosyltransferase regulatory subunit [Lactiplantibacillus brownii]
MLSNLLPLGTRDEFGRRAATKQQLISVIQAHFRQRGLAPIATPLLENQAVFSPYQMGNYQYYRLLDPEGQTLVLRPDMTLPIARFLSATKVPLPQKFGYVGDIFRVSRRLSGSYNQITQAGVELIGYAAIKAELECLTIANQLSSELIDDAVEIELGDAQFAQQVVASLTTDVAQQADIKWALFNKQVPKYAALIAAFRDNPLFDFLERWPRLFGQPAVIFNQLRAAPLPESVTPGIGRLRTVVDWMAKTMPDQAVSVDLSSQAPQKYYTGLTFRGYSQAGAGYLFSGGRYDQLLANFQAKNEPAVGMGLDVDLLTTLALSQAPAAIQQLIYFEPQQWRQAERLLAKTPQAQLSLASDLPTARAEALQRGATLIDLTEGELDE